jgi:hypothetical protein
VTSGYDHQQDHHDWGAFEGLGSNRLTGMISVLTHIKITSAKPSEKLYRLHDSLGLFLAVKPNGSKLWRMSYCFLGKQRELHIGLWPHRSAL